MSITSVHNAIPITGLQTKLALHCLINYDNIDYDYARYIYYYPWSSSPLKSFLNLSPKLHDEHTALAANNQTHLQPVP